VAKKNKEFVSNVTGEVWHKINWKKWNKIIDHVGIMVEGHTSPGKNGTTVALNEGDEVFIDDIRGRINPQFRATDPTGKIWFIPISKVKVIEGSGPGPDTEYDRGYRGGVRIKENENG
tara:strand:+ start:13602 stop:13955 length:354 start_codon:yes stop_codon:yes gene_type:complete